jgi:hypothetical protein
MGKYDDPNLYLPDGQGLIRFPAQDRWILRGDERQADTLRGAALQLKAGLDQGNVNALNQCSAMRRYDDGSVIEVRKNYNFYELNIYCPHVPGPQEAQPIQIVPPLEPGQFFWVPGCFARYGFQEGQELHNEILLKAGSLDGDTSNEGFGTVFENLDDVGLPPPGTSPDGSISRRYRTCWLEGVGPDSGEYYSQFKMASAHIPAKGSFSISCVVRLREPIQVDYSFQYRTAELGNGYTVWNPIKARLLTSEDGVTWSSACPGSLAPLVGYKIPSRFSNHWVNFTYPWPSFNEDFVAGIERQIGCREIGRVCPNEPLMASDYAPASPYWDKVSTGDLETLHGEFVSSWSENAEVQNFAPYASYCKFKVEGDHGKAVGTRAVASLDDGGKRYATVYSVEYERNQDNSIKATIFTLKDYQYKRFVADARPDVTFGMQPFPVAHPEGYMIGVNIMGLCWFNGDRIIAGKICDFESEYNLNTIVSDPLDIGLWYHVLMSYDENGVINLYVAKLGERTIQLKSGIASTGTYVNMDGFGRSEKIMVGSDSWRLTPKATSPESEDTSEWVYSSSMDIGLLRFYHRALSKAEAQVLAMEVLDGVFVADDQEAGQLVAAGYVPITV